MTFFTGVLVHMPGDLPLLHGVHRHARRLQRHHRPRVPVLVRRNGRRGGESCLIHFCDY